MTAKILLKFQYISRSELLTPNLSFLRQMYINTMKQYFVQSIDNYIDMTNKW